jgi:hypothetical protein
VEYVCSVVCATSICCVYAVEREKECVYVCTCVRVYMYVPVV